MKRKLNETRGKFIKFTKLGGTVQNASLTLPSGYQGGVVPTPYGFLHVTLVAYGKKFRRFK